ncbi:hypothetical protein ACR79D_25135, partial [Sphingobacterium multivorum]
MSDSSLNIKIKKILWHHRQDRPHYRNVTAKAVTVMGAAGSSPSSGYRAYGWKRWALSEVRSWISRSARTGSSSQGAMGKLITDNPELLLYTEGTFHVTVLGGIKLTGLDRLRVTLKLTLSGKTEKT